MKATIDRKLLVPVYSVGVMGAFMQVAGGTWDVSWHILGLVETFFTLPHTILYGGIALSLLAATVGLILRSRGPTAELEKRLLLGLHVALAGGVMQLVAGPFDFWWHATFGFDPFLFTPSHSLLIIGIAVSGLGMTIGSATVLHAYQAKLIQEWFFSSSRWLQFLVIIGLTTLWLDLNALVYMITDIDGIAYTFHLTKEFIRQTSTPAFMLGVVLLALTGSLILVTSKNLLGWRGAALAVASLLSGVELSADLGFRAYVLLTSPAGNLLRRPAAPVTGPEIATYIPLYISFLLPVALFDLSIRDMTPRNLLLAAALVAPFASFLDGFFGVILWSRLSQAIPLLVLPLLAAGVVGGLSRVKFTGILLNYKLADVSATLKR